MSELRWNPLLKTWTMVASHRQDRPQMPKDWCPFCPGSGKVPENYDVYKYDNDFPALSLNPPNPDDVGTEFYKVLPSYGKCEVILYSPNHNEILADLSVEHIIKLIKLWIERVNELSKDKNIKYIFPFENKGEEVGVTMPHPHGQIYGYSFVPLKLEIELNSCKEYFLSNNKCLICKMNEEEINFKKRIIFENKNFISYIPFFTDYPYGVFIVSKNHIDLINKFNDEQVEDLAWMLKITTGSFEKVFDRPFPYMMCIHQSPVNSQEYQDSDKYYHFHIEFYPPLRAKDKIKYNASSETGAMAAANVVSVEKSSKTLRYSKLRYMSEICKNNDNFDLIKTEMIKDFKYYFDENNNEINVFSSPARVNLIGEHIDYNGGYVLPASLDLYNYMAIRIRNDRNVNVYDLGFDEYVSFSVDDNFMYDNKIKWSNYIRGILQVLKNKNYIPNFGFDIIFFSEIPSGSGLSSSAAFEVVFCYGLNKIFNWNIKLEDIALICQKAENEYVGVNCGIMDQFAVALGNKNYAILLNCDTLDYKYIPLNLGDYKIVITNTNKKRELSNSKYNERLEECKKGLSIIQKYINIKNLCELTPDIFEKYKNVIDDEVIKKRVTHVVYENYRVIESVNLLNENKLEKFGILMAHSHSSLRDNYEVTGLELDTLFEEARKFSGCIATRMTGAGFGGCTVSFVHKDKIKDFIEYISKKYFEETGLKCTFYICETGYGVRKL